ncbi:MAG TPA: EAL domain-containing protein, partial [Acidimicrobiales bacterium]|nr:EAL domain-containing protein [Acidimicrobiales bacterium]
AYLDRFQGPHHIEVVCQWRATDVRYAPPGTSRGGPGYFPWAARQLARDPVLVVSKLTGLGPEASTDVENLRTGDDPGFVWIRVGPARRPTGLFGLTFDGPLSTEQPESYEPLIGFAGTMLAIVSRREEEARRREQHRVFESIARGEAVETVLEQVCRLRETGSPGQFCVAWLADDDGRLHPVDPKTSGVALDDFDPCPQDAPEAQTYRLPERKWGLRDAAASDDADPVGARFGAGAVDLIPLVNHSRDEVVGVLAVYDTSRLPLDPGEGAVGDWTELAASLASVAIERVTDLARLAHRATHDSLTGLANRESFLSALERAIADSGPVDRLVAVLYCDVDRFKEFNDRLGHAHGDRFLVAIGRLIEAQVRSPAVVARLGGDEFAIILEQLTDENDALVVAERIRTAVRTSSAAPGSVASVSIGVAVSGSAAEHAEGLLRDADIAMYQAKSSGRDRVEVFAERIRREAHARDRLGRELRVALESGDVDVHYQPMVDLRDGRLMGFEALARWRHPTRGFIPPSEFIPIAEAGGLIGALGERVLERALEVAGEWDGLDLHVNLSARQVDTVGLVEGLLDRVAASHVPVERVALEITESVLLSESAPTLENLGVLASSGVGLVLDDFGTGYASLTYLRRFPFRGIKVDRSFVSGIERSADDATIVSMVLALATSLGLEVIAEGVETVGQEERLREMGCRYVQGFRYSVPIPAQGVAALIDRHGQVDRKGPIEPFGSGGAAPI